MFRFLLTAVCFAACSMAQTATAAGSIQGTVTDASNNKPIAKAFVSATRTVLPPLRVTVESGADGSFTIGGLPAATYTLCVAPAADGYLDPCVWNPPAPTVTLAAGQKSSGHILRIQPGSILKIHLDDPSQLLTQKTKTGYLPHLAMGVRTPQATSYPAHVAATSAAGADYQVTVPRDTNLVFSIQSFSLKLADANAVPLANNTARQTFQHASGDANPPGFNYKVTGLIP
jgi:Carboxypeptidase regulatory-like domain